MAMASCPVCNEFAQRLPKTGDFSHYKCPQCGEFEINGTSTATINGEFEKRLKRHLVSGWIRQQYDKGEIPRISDYDYEKLSLLIEIPLIEKADKLLLSFVADSPSYLSRCNSADKKYIAKIYAKDEDEYQYVLGRILYKKKQLVEVEGSSRTVLITPEGWIYAEDLMRKSPSSKQGFVAMWFHESMKPIWQNAIEPAIREAGFQPLRIDRKEHNDKIDDQIIAEIQRSRFVVADFTGHRDGVYFEAGYALGRGIPVIWACRKDHIKKLHFDIRQYNMIDWSDEADLKNRLHNRVRALIGEIS